MTKSLHIVVGLALVSALTAGCVREAPQPVYQPAPQPAPRALSIQAERRQSQQQQDRDKGDCQSMASAQAHSSETWAAAFTACMTTRGYSVR